MVINRNNVFMTRGDSETIVVSTTQDGAYVPLVEGDKITFTVRKSLDTPKLISKTVEAFDEGKAVIAIDPVDTNTLLFGEYVYDIQLTRADGRVKTIVKPSMFVLRGEVSYE